MKVSFLFLLLVWTLPAVADSPARVLFSHYAPGIEPVQLFVNGDLRSDELGYGETDAFYRAIDGGVRRHLAVRGEQGVHAATNLDLEVGDHSVFLYLDSQEQPALAVSRDPVAAFDFPPPFDFETSDANAAGRFLSFARLGDDPLYYLQGEAQEFLVSADGPRTGASVESAFGVGLQPALGRAFHASVNERYFYEVTVSVGTGSVESLDEIILSEQFDLPVGTTDYVLIGDADSLQIVARPRARARSARIDGIYGEPGINGSGVQLFELPDIGRVYGWLYSYDANGLPTWYYLDSRCDLERGFQCTTPGHLVASGSYLVAIYQASNGRFANGYDADLEAVGSGRLRVSSRNAGGAFLGGGVRAPTAELVVWMMPPSLDSLPFGEIPDAILDFSLIQR